MMAFLVILFLNIAVIAAICYKLHSKYFHLQLDMQVLTYNAKHS